jgi:hypothetical protein
MFMGFIELNQGTCQNIANSHIVPYQRMFVKNVMESHGAVCHNVPWSDMGCPGGVLGVSWECPGGVLGVSSQCPVVSCSVM